MPSPIATRQAALGPEAGFGWYTADKDEPICTTMERLGTLPFAAQPGESWVYGYNTDILGCIVERVSGMPLDQFVRLGSPNRSACATHVLPADAHANGWRRSIRDSDGTSARR